MSYTRVVGAFNCQGAGWYPEEYRCKSMSGPVSLNGVEWEQKD